MTQWHVMQGYAHTNHANSNLHTHTVCVYTSNMMVTATTIAPRNFNGYLKPVQENNVDQLFVTQARAR